MSAATLPGEEIPASARVPRLSYFFPAHNEEANLAGLVVGVSMLAPELV